MEYKDKDIIQILRERDGKQTTVKLVNGKKHEVWNIAWGYDIGDEFAHVTSNISPSVANTSVDFFYTNEIVQVVETITGSILFEK